MGSILALLEASRRRRSIAAEAFRATLAGLTATHVQVEPITWSAPQLVGTLAAESLPELYRTVRSAVEGFVEECRIATADHAR